MVHALKIWEAISTWMAETMHYRRSWGWSLMMALKTGATEPTSLILNTTMLEFMLSKWEISYRPAWISTHKISRSKTHLRIHWLEVLQAARLLNNMVEIQERIWRKSFNQWNFKTMREERGMWLQRVPTAALQLRMEKQPKPQRPRSNTQTDRQKNRSKHKFIDLKQLYLLKSA